MSRLPCFSSKLLCEGAASWERRRLVRLTPREVHDAATVFDQPLFGQQRLFLIFLVWRAKGSRETCRREPRETAAFPGERHSLTVGGNRRRFLKVDEAAKSWIMEPLNAPS